jgi:hypothetical protein
MKWNATLLAGLLLAMTLTLLNACSSEKKQQAASDPKDGITIEATTSGQKAESGSAAGIDWKIPKGWVKGPDKAMRAATYLVGSDAAQAECAVFYFGAGQGGDVEANIARWISQVNQPDGSDSKTIAVRGEVKSVCCKITTIEVGGTYLASSGPMMQSATEKPGYVLLGGIAPAPQGNVFFKMTGPKETIGKVKAEFLQMLESVNTRAD